MPDDHEFGDEVNVVRFAPRTEQGAAESTLTFLPFDRWDDTTPPALDWAVDLMMPRANVTLLSGEGAVGKSILVMQLCVAIAAARDWIRQMPAPGAAIYLGAEDDEDECRRRFTAIARHYKVSFNELVGRLFVSSLAGKDAVLAVADRNGLVRPTMLFQQLLELVRKIRPILIGLDTAADMFAGNENDRAQVRQFIGLLRLLAIAGHSAVLLASHPSRTGVSDESGLSGSTAWHNSVRSRLYLKTATNDEDARDTGLRVLEMRKSNYGPQAENIPLRWDAGVFKPIESLKQGHERAAAEAADEAVFLNLLGRFTTSGRTVSDKPSRSFAVSQFVLEPEGAALGSKRLDQAMRRLFARNRIGVESYGRPSNPHSKIVTRELF